MVDMSWWDRLGLVSKKDYEELLARVDALTEQVQSERARLESLYTNQMQAMIEAQNEGFAILRELFKTAHEGHEKKFDALIGQLADLQKKAATQQSTLAEQMARQQTDTAALIGKLNTVEEMVKITWVNNLADDLEKVVQSRKGKR